MTATITVVTPDSLFSEMAVKPANTAITALAYESLFFEGKAGHSLGEAK